MVAATVDVAVSTVAAANPAVTVQAHQLVAAAAAVAARSLAAVAVLAAATPAAQVAQAQQAQQATTPRMQPIHGHPQTVQPAVMAQPVAAAAAAAAASLLAPLAAAAVAAAQAVTVVPQALLVEPQEADPSVSTPTRPQ
jgi:hypothetical protein